MKSEAESLGGNRPRSGGRGLPFALLAGFLLLLSIILTFRGARPTWADEAFTMRIAPVYTSLFWEEINRDVHPPLYFALSTLARELGPRSLKSCPYASPPSVRVFSYLVFLTLIWLTLRLASERTARPGQIAPSALLIFASAHLALFGPMLRYYGLSALGVTCATLLLLPARQEAADSPGRTPIGRAVWYGVAMWIAIASSHLSAIVLPAHIAYIIERREPKARPFWYALLGLAIACIPLFLILRIQLHHMSVSDQPGLAGLLIGAVARGIFSLYSFTMGEFIRPWDWGFSIPSLTAFFCLMFLAWRVRKTPLGGLLWLVLSVSLPIGALVLSWIGVGVEFSPARLFFLAPMFLVLMGLGITSEGISANARRAGLIAVTVLVIVNLASSFNFRRGEDSIQSTYIIPWSAISDEITLLAESFRSTAVYTDDPTMHYWLTQDDPEKLRSCDIDHLMSEDLMDPGAPEQAPPELAVFVYSPRRYSDEDIEWAASKALHAMPQMITETEYIEEDETSVRWKSMLLRRPVYATKKKLVAFTGG